MVFEQFDCHVQFPFAPFYDMIIFFEVPVALQLILRSGFGTGKLSYIHHRKKTLPIRSLESISNIFKNYGI